MSWFSDNYEKAALGGAAVVAIAFGFIIVSNNEKTAEAFKRENVNVDNDVSVPGLEDIREAKESLSAVQVLTPPTDPAGRKVDLMTGVHLFVKRGAPNAPVDLLKSEPVHKGIPNIWWGEYGLNPGYSDSPELDPDKDGFTNREEQVAQTDPTDFKSHPDPVTKLKASSVNTLTLYLKASDYGSDKYKFKLQSPRGAEHGKMGIDPIVAGQVIEFVDAVMQKEEFTGLRMQKRFKFKEVEKKKNAMGGLEKIWVFEDLKPNKPDTLYRFDRRGKPVGAGANGINDNTIELTLQALGEGGNPFKLEENIRFSLPYDEKATKKPYLLKKVDLDAKTVEIEYSDSEGNKKSHNLSYTK